MTTLPTASGLGLPHPLRLSPGQDLREALQHERAHQGWAAAYVLAGIGSLAGLRLRLAGAQDSLVRTGDFEILQLAGSLSPDGPHLHMSVADAAGAVLGGHVQPGCLIRTTAEILLLPLPGWQFRREHDAATGHAELVVTAGPQEPAFSPPAAPAPGP